MNSLHSEPGAHLRVREAPTAAKKEEQMVSPGARVLSMDLRSDEQARGRQEGAT